MLKFLYIVIFVSCLPLGARAAEQDATAARTLLQKITEFKIFKLRLPSQIQRSIPTPQAQTAVANSLEESCSSQAQPRQKGAEIAYSCDTLKVLKTELSAVATN